MEAATTAVEVVDDEDFDGEDERIPIDYEERLQQVWDLRCRGMALPGIAKMIGKSVQTVRRDLKKYGDMYREKILQANPIELLSDNLQWLDEMERIALYEVHTSETKIEKIKDEKTGVITEISTPDPNKARFYTNALKAREMKLRLLIDTGLIPTGDPNKMFCALEAYQDHEEDLEKENRTPEEIKSSIKRLLTGGRHM